MEELFIEPLIFMLHTQLRCIKIMGHEGATQASIKGILVIQCMESTSVAGKASPVLWLDTKQPKLEQYITQGEGETRN